MNGVDLKNNFVLNSSGLVKEICDPLLLPIDITYFNYIKIYNSDCSREMLTNNAVWIDHFYKNALFNSVGAIDVEHLIPKGYFLWNQLDTKDAIYQQGREYFNIDNGITFILKRQDMTLCIFSPATETTSRSTIFTPPILTYCNALFTISLMRHNH